MSVTNTGASPDHPRPDAGNGFPQAVLFDLLTALLDSWTVWNAAAGSEPQGARGAGTCAAPMAAAPICRAMVAEAAEAVGLPASAPAALEANWGCCRPGTARASCWRRCVRIAGWAWSPTAPGAGASRRRAAGRGLGRGRDVGRGGLLQAGPAALPAGAGAAGRAARRAAFVAGSGYDLFGTSRVGLRTYWHNRVGLALPPARPSRNANRRAWPRRCRGWRALTPESLPAHGIGRQPSVARTSGLYARSGALHGSAGISRLIR